ncbi:MAG: aminotransferase class I/II-fold pyridoxal phosphate-dependent enzyme [Dysgonamonadaceae bacterium]|jgi:aspartate/methionine/tyrosine aminotransferase|nr:aminotransferase class I/II-fold pyridoxal phosphate-dependent enzyme [Dysgonamonadaceae bacterium]
MEMIEPANRLNAVNEYYFSRKLKEVAEMNSRGMDVINLGVGSPDMPPSEKAIETLCTAARRTDTHGYQPYTGIPELRRSFSEWYHRRYRVDLDPNTEILPLIGSKEGILHVSLTFLNAGDGVLTPNPGYPTYTSVGRLVEARIVPYSLKEENGWQPDFNELERTDLSGIKLMWVNYPNMPTGAPATRELFEKLVDFGRRHRIVICHDNPYSFILNDHPLSILETEGAKDVCIELNSLSKSHNMPGWRIAMLASNGRFVEWILKVKSNIDSGQFRPMMLAAVEALNVPDSWYGSINAVYGGRRRAAEEVMRALGCVFDPKQSGLFLWGRIPEGYEQSGHFADRILYDCRVFITPGLVFGSGGERYVRISLCATEERLMEARERILGG